MAKNATKKGLFINYVSDSLLHTNEKEDGGEVINVSIPVSQSKTGFGSFAVNPAQVYAATKQDGTEVEEYSNILLGQADKTRKVSICTKAATGSTNAQYGVIEMTNADIVNTFKASRKAYKESLKERQRISSRMHCMCTS